MRIVLLFILLGWLAVAILLMRADAAMPAPPQIEVRKCP